MISSPLCCCLVCQWNNLYRLRLELFIVRSIVLLLLLLPFLFFTFLSIRCDCVYRGNSSNCGRFRSPYLLTFLYANWDNVDTYNKVHSQEGYQIDDFPAFLRLFNFDLLVSISKETKIILFISYFSCCHLLKKIVQNPVSAMFVFQCILINETNIFIFGIKHHLIYSFTCYNKLFLISNEFCRSK